MRSDMYKVIVERPRHKGYNVPRMRPLRDPEDERPFESIKFQHQRDPKSLNENLRPLQRFLERQVGRPWDRVFSELCARIDRRNTVQQHIHQHVGDFIALRVREIEGELHDLGRYGDPWPLARCHLRLYVHPSNGLLLLNHAGISFMREKKLILKERRKQREPIRRDIHVIDEWTQLRRIGTFWYEVRLALIPKLPESITRYNPPHVLDRLVPWDVLAHRPARPHVHKNGCISDWNCPARLYGRDDVYAYRKRRLNRIELRKYALHDVDADSQASVQQPTKYRAPVRAGARHKEH